MCFYRISSRALKSRLVATPKFTQQTSLQQQLLLGDHDRETFAIVSRQCLSLHVVYEAYPTESISFAGSAQVPSKPHHVVVPPTQTTVSCSITQATIQQSRPTRQWLISIPLTFPRLHGMRPHTLPNSTVVACSFFQSAPVDLHFVSTSTKVVT